MSLIVTFVLHRCCYLLKGFVNHAANTYQHEPRASCIMGWNFPGQFYWENLTYDKNYRHVTLRI